MDVHEQLQVLERLAADIERKVGWQINCEPSHGGGKVRVGKANHFSMTLFESKTKNITAFAVIHPRLGCLDIVIGKRFFNEAEIERMSYVQALPNSGLGRNCLRWRICQAGGKDYDEAVYWLSVACRPTTSCASCNPRNLPGG